MEAIIGDIGNTITKICIIQLNNFKIKKLIYFDSKNINSKKFLKKKFANIINKKKIIKVCLFSSVVPNYEFLMKKFLKQFYKIRFIEINNKSINKIVKVNFKNKKQVGSDRIANAVGAYTQYKTNCIVLDFGTATTFDVVTKRGFYNGGIIAPGINLSIKSLANSAAQISNFLIKKPKRVIGKNTLEALRSGFYWGYLGLINNIILKIEKESNLKYKIIFTGGYAGLFRTSIARPFKINKNITIEGIIEIFKKNIKYLN